MLNALSTGELLLGHACRRNVGKRRQLCRLPTDEERCERALQEPAMGVGRACESQCYVCALCVHSQL